MYEPLDLILLYTEGEITAGQFDELQRLLNDSVEMRQLYRDTIDHSISMRSLLLSTASELKSPHVLTPARRQSQSIWYAAAALVILVITAWLMLQTGSEVSRPHTADRPLPALAMLSDMSADAVFSGDAGSGMKLGADLPAGPIHLLSGQAQLMFESTAVVDVIGPCTLQILGPNHALLLHGRLAAYVPDRAHGFRVDLPDGSRVIDLGTRFNITAVNEHLTSIDIEDGRVRIEPTVGLTRVASAGERGMIDHGRYTALSIIELPLTNADFEDITLEDGEIYLPTTKNRITGWAMIGEHRSGVFNPGPRQYAHNPNTAPTPVKPIGLSGSNSGFAFSAGHIGLQQTTAHRLRPGRYYELRVAVGHRLQDVTAAGYRIELLAGDETIGFIDAEGPTGPRGQFNDVLIVVEPLSPDDPRLGEPLGVRLIKHEITGYFDFDNIRLVSLSSNLTTNHPPQENTP